MTLGHETEIDYLPTVDLRNVRIVGVEALIRPGGPSPNGEARAVTERALELAARAAGDWWRSGLGLQLSVRLPGDAFMSSEWSIDALIVRIPELEARGWAMVFTDGTDEDTVRRRAEEMATLARRRAEMITRIRTRRS